MWGFDTMKEHVITETGKIDIHNVQRDYETALSSLKDDKSVIPENKNLKYMF